MTIKVITLTDWWPSMPLACLNQGAEWALSHTIYQGHQHFTFARSNFKRQASVTDHWILISLRFTQEQQDHTLSPKRKLEVSHYQLIFSFLTRVGEPGTRSTPPVQGDDLMNNSDSILFTGKEETVKRSTSSFLVWMHNLRYLPVLQRKPPSDSTTLCFRKEHNPTSRQRTNLRQSALLPFGQ